MTLDERKLMLAELAATIASGIAATRLLDDGIFNQQVADEIADAAIITATAIMEKAGL